MSQALLQEALGPEAFDRLVREFGGLVIYVPKRARATPADKHQEILEMRRQGLSVKEIARRLKVCMRTVSNQLLLPIG